MDFFLQIFSSALFFPLLGSIFLGVLGVLTVLFLFPLFGLLDFPERYGHNRKPIPYPAGIALFIVFFLSLVFWYTHMKDVKILGFIAGLGLLVTVSFVDDRKNISPLFRLIMQVLSTALVIYSGVWVEWIRNPFSTENLHLPFYLGSIVTALWIIGFVNVSNWLDGVPNLTLGTGFTASCTLGFLSLSVHQESTALLCFLLAGGIFPFLLGNIGKTKFLLGDTGAMMIGFSLAVISILYGGKMATALIVMAIPILDGIYVFMTRLMEKKSPLRGGDKRHLHDRLLLLGWSNGKIFWIYTLISAFLGWSVLLLDSFEKFLVLVFFTLTFFGIRRIIG